MIFPTYLIVFFCFESPFFLLIEGVGCDNDLLMDTDVLAATGLRESVAADIEKGKAVKNQFSKC